MLSRLNIRDFAIIDQLSIEWVGGLTVLTGETGAGKSIIIDAVGALLGERVPNVVVRSGANRAMVEAVFELDAGADTAVGQALAEVGLEPEDGQLILAREIAAAGGRGVSRINGRAVPTSVLGQIGELLVDIHGQSEHLSLLRPREHLDLLDQYAGLDQERARASAIVAEVRAAEREAASLREDVRRAHREQTLLTHEIGEIEAAELGDGEEDALISTRRRLRNVERLRAAVVTASAALDGDDDSRGATVLVGQAQAALAGAASMDPTLDAEVESLTAALAQAEETARSLHRYLDSIEEDPSQLEQIEERLMIIGDLKRKFGDSVCAVLEYADQARSRLRAVEHQDELLAELAEKRDRLRRELGDLAGAMSARRREAGERLACEVERELGDLNMRGTRFRVQVEQQADPGGLSVRLDGVEKSVAFDAVGIDKVEFLIAPNPGAEARGLGRIASGGELARVSLALKTCLSKVDPRATLIFDEIDVGVGGRSAPVVGEKLWTLSADHQVLCVTHLPQVAAFADQHLVVSKGDAGDTVVVRRPSPEDRVEELAQMLGGPLGRGGARRNAEELLAGAAQWKQRRADTVEESA